MNLIFETTLTPDPTEQLVLLALANRCDDEGTNAFPSVATIAKNTRLTARTVQRAVGRLKTRGVLDVTSGQVGRRPNTYTIRFNPCHTVTPDRTSPLTDSHHTPDGESLQPCHSDGGGGVTASDDPSIEPSSEQSGTPERPTPNSEIDPGLIRETWNALTSPPIPRCRELFGSRLKKARARLEDPGLDVMRNVFRAIEESDFCRGDNDRGWRPSIDWALERSNIAKVLEGAYAGGRHRARIDEGIQRRVKERPTTRWSRLCDRLAEKGLVNTFDRQMWLDQVSVIEDSVDRLVVLAPPGVHDWIRRKFPPPTLDEALREVEPSCGLEIRRSNDEDTFGAANDAEQTAVRASA